MTSLSNDLFEENDTVKWDFLQNVWLVIKQITEFSVKFLNLFGFINLRPTDWATRLFADLIRFVNFQSYVSDWSLHSFKQELPFILEQMYRLKQTLVDIIPSTWNTVIDQF